MKFYIIIFLCIFIHNVSNAQVGDFYEKTITEVSSAENPLLAKKEMISQANQDISQEIIQSLIGNEKYEKNKSLIINRVLRSSEKYILFSKTGDVKKTDSGYQQEVQLKVSLKDLKLILQQYGLLNTLEGYRSILPLVSLTDQESGNNYGWWYTQENNAAKKVYESFEKVISNEFEKNEVFLLETSELKTIYHIPSIYRTSYLTDEDKDFLSNYFQTPLVLDGVLLIKPTSEKKVNIEAKLVVIQIGDGKVVADLKRKIEVPANKMQEEFMNMSFDLAVQVKDGWQKGIIGTDTIKLTFKGFYPPKKIESLMEKIKAEVLILRNLKERNLSSSELVLEANTTSSSEALIKKITELEVDGKKLENVSTTKGEIVFK